MKDQTSLKPLFKGGSIAGQFIANRAMLAPMTRTSATDDGLATAQMRDYYVDFAKGGFGAVISEGIYTDQTFSQGYLNQPGLSDQAQTDAWKPVVEAVQHNGAKMIAQLMHAGGQIQGNRFVDGGAAPSAVAPKGEKLGFYGGEGEFAAPRAMTKGELVGAIRGFAEAARRAKEAGFDGVEIHGANGYLLDQFLSTYFNRREDSYGGSVENRLRFVLDVIHAVRDAVGPDFMVGIRLSQMKVTDPDYKWESLDEARTIIRAIGEAPVDYLHFSEADAHAPAMTDTDRSLAGLAKTLVAKPVIANGSLGDPDTAAQLLEQDWADFVAIGKAALANRDWPNAVKDGQSLREINFSMMMPRANLTNEQQWRDDNGVPATHQNG